MPGRQSKEILDRIPAGTEDGLRGTGQLVTDPAVDGPLGFFQAFPGI